MAMIPGYLARLFLNNRAFAFVMANVESQADTPRTTNSEGAGPAAIPVPGFHVNIGANRVLTATVQGAAFDPANNFFLAPIVLAENQIISFQLFLTGLGGLSWYAPSFRVARVGQRFDVNGISPVDFAGESLGFYSLPST
jgi:hypothetical protein